MFFGSMAAASSRQSMRALMGKSLSQPREGRSPRARVATLCYGFSIWFNLHLTLSTP